VRQARDIAARARHALHQLAAHRIGNHDEDDRDGSGRALRRQGGQSGDRHDEVDLERGKLGRLTGEPFKLLVGEALLQPDGLALDVAESGQSLSECAQVDGLFLGASRVPQDADGGHPGRRLRLEGARHREGRSQRVSRKRRRFMAEG
jgi:hypothetical protein